MKKAIIGRKVGMTQIFDENGNVIPVTVVEAGPCVVVSKQTVDVNGYESVALGFDDIKAHKATKPVKGQFDKAGVAPKKVLKEFKLDDCAGMSIGDIVKADVFATGDIVDVTGTSKGKGFAGTVKRWNTHIGPKAHGSGYHRGQGSMGANTDPSRVMKGKVMPGRLGGEQVTVQSLEVVKIDGENNVIAIRAAIPGPRGGLIYIKSAVKA